MRCNYSENVRPRKRWPYKFQRTETPFPPWFTSSPLIATTSVEVGYGSCSFLVKLPTCMLAHLLYFYKTHSVPTCPRSCSVGARSWVNPVWRVSTDQDFDINPEVFPDVVTANRPQPLQLSSIFEYIIVNTKKYVLYLLLPSLFHRFHDEPEISLNPFRILE